ncbi:helix-turn-helix domain-containing protein [Geoalkalibacter sp.]|uniref:helix-turn-helix domain-containing protein n=1 Tax=Geoalkalibacter sp. TaxID=3041440 RepID=UPI00272DD501|nr:helix-turn-helix domain-containing protein [Geoalkalibacter sp.]
MKTKTSPAKPAAVPAPDSFSPAPPAEQEPFISVAEGAALLSIPENTLYKMALARRIPSYKCGKLRRFRRSELVAYFESHRVQAAE